MPTSCKLKGSYEVVYSCKADPAKETRPPASTYRKLEIIGPPFALLCFDRRKDVQPARIIPWERVIGITEKTEAETPTTTKAEDKPKTKDKPS